MAVFTLSLASSVTGVVESICGFGWVGRVEIDLWNFGCAVRPVGRVQFCDLSADSSVMGMGAGWP